MEKEKSLSLEIPLDKAEDIRKYLIRKHIINKSLKIFKQDKFIYFPIKNDYYIYISNHKQLEKFNKKEKIFLKNKTKQKSYKDIIAIPNDLKKFLPSSYDEIGDLILIKIPDNLSLYKKEIGASLLIINKKIKSIFSISPIIGEMRTREIEIIAGENKTETVHKEYNLKFKVDINKAYFSTRLANERKKIASIVKDNEIIIDMFAGVAPFSIMIAKYANPEIIYAIDKNKEAIKYAKYNIKINKVLDKVEVINADSKNIPKIMNKKSIKADRIIMNLPFSSDQFFSSALKISKEKVNIHYYSIINGQNINFKLRLLKSIAKDNGFKLVNLPVRKIKTYSPREFYICIDITATKI
jgi:tRNA (guanine37-N1)-methyltransferase